MTFVLYDEAAEKVDGETQELEITVTIEKVYYILYNRFYLVYCLCSCSRLRFKSGFGRPAEFNGAMCENGTCTSASSM